MIADGSDNFATRYLVSDACYLAEKPLVTGAVGVFDGTLTTMRAHERNAKRREEPVLPLSVSGTAAAWNSPGVSRKPAF